MLNTRFKTKNFGNNLNPEANPCFKVIFLFEDVFSSMHSLHESRKITIRPKIIEKTKIHDMSDIGAFLINTPRKAITAKLISYR